MGENCTLIYYKNNTKCSYLNFSKRSRPSSGFAARVTSGRISGCVLRRVADVEGVGVLEDGLVQVARACRALAQSTAVHKLRTVFTGL